MISQRVSAPRALGVAIVLALGGLNAVDSTETAAYFAPLPGPIVETETAPLPIQEPESQPQHVEEEAAMEAWPPSREAVVAAVLNTWPEQPGTALYIVSCESDDGQHWNTYNLEAANAGPMQINQWTWREFFEQNHGWSWEQVVLDLDVHLQASRIIYDRAGGWWPWSCW